MDEESIRNYQTSKGTKEDVSALVLRKEPDLSAVGLGKQTLLGMAGDALAAVGRFIQSSETRDAARRETVSAKVGQSKRRPRLFADVNLGSMEQVDDELKGGSK